MVSLLSRLFSVFRSEVGEAVITRQIPIRGEGELAGLSINAIKVLGEYSYRLHHTYIIAEPLFAGKYFLDLTLVLALSHSKGEFFSNAPIVEEVLSRTHPSRFNRNLDTHNLRSGS